MLYHAKESGGWFTPTMHPVFQTRWGIWVPRTHWEGQIWPGPQLLVSFAQVADLHVLKDVVGASTNGFLWFVTQPLHSKSELWPGQPPKAPSSAKKKFKKRILIQAPCERLHITKDLISL